MLFKAPGISSRTNRNCPRTSGTSTWMTSNSSRTAGASHDLELLQNSRLLKDAPVLLNDSSRNPLKDQRNLFKSLITTSNLLKDLEPTQELKNHSWKLLDVCLSLLKDSWKLFNGKSLNVTVFYTSTSGVHQGELYRH